MVAYVDKNGNMGSDSGSQAVNKMLGGGTKAGAPPATSPSPAPATAPSGAPEGAGPAPAPANKRSHPRDFKIIKRATKGNPSSEQTKEEEEKLKVGNRGELSGRR